MSKHSIESYGGLITRLCKTLAAQYPFPNEMRAVATQAKLNFEKIPQASRPIDAWWNILKTALDQNKMIELIRMALNDFPGNHVLLEADQVFAMEQPEVIEKPKIRKGAHKKALRTLLIYLDNSWIGFKAQKSNRIALHDRMVKRLEMKPMRDVENFFPTYFDQMNQYEKRVHKVIRNYTFYIRQNNAHALTILNNHPELESLVPKIKQLKRHLKVWLIKFDGVFVPDEAMCILYTNMYDRMPFPKGVENDIKSYLKK